MFSDCTPFRTVLLPNGSIRVFPYYFTAIRPYLRLYGNAEIAPGVVYVVIFISKKRQQYESTFPPQENILRILPFINLTIPTDGDIQRRIARLHRGQGSEQKMGL